jgi:hypothetical protein
MKVTIKRESTDRQQGSILQDPLPSLSRECFRDQSASIEAQVLFNPVSAINSARQGKSLAQTYTHIALSSLFPRQGNSQGRPYRDPYAHTPSYPPKPLENHYKTKTIPKKSLVRKHFLWPVLYNSFNT